MCYFPKVKYEFDLSINQTSQLILYWMIASSMKKIALCFITHQRQHFFGLKTNLLFKSWIQRLTACEKSLLYGACTPLWWYYFVFKTLTHSILYPILYTKESFRRSLLPGESEPFILQRGFCLPSPIWRDEVWSRSLELSIELNLPSDTK